MEQKVQRYIYPHLTLLNVACYHKCNIERKLQENDREGVALESLSCLVMLAFSVEGLINAIGEELIEGWVEKRQYHLKLEDCLNVLEMEDDQSVEPFKTLAELKILRDQVAHPKVIKGEVKIARVDEIFNYLDADWEKYAEPGYAINAFSQLNEFEKMVQASPKMEDVYFYTHSGPISGP